MEIINDINTLQDNISPLKNEPITNPNATIPLNYTQMTNGSHTMLQSQLKFICDKIEEALTQYRNAQQEKENEGRVQSTILGVEGNSLKQKINNYKELSQNIKYKKDKTKVISRSFRGYKNVFDDFSEFCTKKELNQKEAVSDALALFMKLNR